VREGRGPEAPGREFLASTSPVRSVAAGLVLDSGTPGRGDAAAATLKGGAPQSPTRAPPSTRSAQNGSGTRPGQNGTEREQSGQGSGRALLRPPPAWAVSPGRQWSVSPAHAGIETIQRVAAAAAARERGEQHRRDRLRDVLGVASVVAAAAVRAAAALTHAIGACHIFLLYLVSEPLFVPIVASSVNSEPRFPKPRTLNPNALEPLILNPKP